MSPRPDRADRLLAGQPRVGRRDRARVRRHRPDALGVARAGTAAPRSRTRPTTPPSSARRSPSWSPRPGPTPTCSATTRSRSHRCPSTPTPSAASPSPARRTWNSKDALLYALGVGAGAADPLAELEFTTENTTGTPQRALPTIAVVLGPLGGGVRDHRHVQPGDARPRRAGHHAAPGDPRRGRARGRRRDHRHLRQGQGRRRRHRDHGHAGEHRRAAVLDPHVGVHPRRGRLGRRPRPVGQPERGPRARRPTTPSRCRPATTRRCSTACRATATRCTPTRRSRRWAASTGPSSTACAPTASPAGPCSTRCAAATRPASRAWTPASPRRSCPARRSP